MERSCFLVETSWLAEHLQDHGLRIVDMRGYVRTVEKDGIQATMVRRMSGEDARICL